MYHLHSLDSYHGPRDERGLIPVETARELLSLGGQYRRAQSGPQGAEEAAAERWAALLSLADFDEFRRLAANLDGGRFYDQRGEDLALRYADEVLDWISEFIIQSCLLDRGWPLPSVLCGCEQDAAFELVWSLVSLNAPHGGLPDASANNLVLQWIWAFPSLGFFLLSEKAKNADERALLILRSLAQCHPACVFRFVAWGQGDSEARRIFELAKVTIAIERSAVASILDYACSSPDGWPRFLAEAPEQAYHALRMLAWRSARGSDWLLVFERVEGSDERSAVVRRFAVSSWPVPPRSWVSHHLGVFAEPSDGAQLKIYGPRGTVSISQEDLASDRLGAGWHTALGLRDEQHALLIRAYLETKPDAFWSDHDSILSELALDAELELLVESRGFEHAVGSDAQHALPSLHPQATANPARVSTGVPAAPSTTPVFQSLIDAIVSGDAGRFKPGETNLDWRQHAVFSLQAEEP